MRYLVLFFIVYSIQIHAQDQIIYLNGNEHYVDHIIDIKNDSLKYSSYKKTKKVPLTEVKGYFITIDSRENLKKRFYKREREYHVIDSIYHFDYYNRHKKVRDNVTDFIQSCLPTDFTALSFVEGFYITFELDTVHTLISDFKDSKKNSAVFIAKIDSNDFKIFTPKLVKKYSLGNQVFLSYYPKQIDSQDIYMFIRQEISGKINLFNKPNLPYHEGDYYLVNRVGTDIFYHLCPDNYCTSNNIEGFQKTMVMGSVYGESGFMFVSTNPNLDNSFNEIMPQLVYDCESLANRIRSEFYTKADIEFIINQYNNGCE